MQRSTDKHLRKRLIINLRDSQPLSPMYPLEHLKELICHLISCRLRKNGKKKSAQGGAIGYHAQKHLELIENGQKIKTDAISYPVQSWTFGNQLSILFLASEVVVDFSLRLKKEYDSKRLWVGAYANAFPGYIPSERVLAEGGYEGGGAMLYFGQPTRFAPGVEQLVIDTVHKVLPPKCRPLGLR